MEHPMRTLSPSMPPLYGSTPPLGSLMNGSGCVFDHYGRIPEGIYKADTFSSPLEEAVFSNDIGRFKELVTEGHEVTVKLQIGEMTCIEFCGMMGQVEILQSLIESSVNASILHDYFSLDDVVDRAYMISKNKRVFFGQEALAEANRYEAALFTAVEYNQPDCVRVMLDYLGAREPGKHAFKTENNGQKQLSASELAEVRGHAQCSEILKNHLYSEVINS